jgi:hypothetical protein
VVGGVNLAETMPNIDRSSLIRTLRVDDHGIPEIFERFAKCMYNLTNDRSRYYVLALVIAAQ